MQKVMGHRQQGHKGKIQRVFFFLKGIIQDSGKYSVMATMTRNSVEHQ